MASILQYCAALILLVMAQARSTFARLYRTISMNDVKADRMILDFYERLKLLRIRKYNPTRRWIERQVSLSFLHEAKGTPMVKRNKEISFDESGDCSTEIQEQFQKNVEAFEQAEWIQPFQILTESGISLPPPGELADAELNAKLWEIINALALMGAYLEHTDHLSDRELYILLWSDVLLEEMVIQSSVVTLTCHIDLIGSGSEEDNNIYLKYYADDDDRTLWVKEFSDEPVPGRELLPFDRDHQLPKPDPDEKFGIH